MNPLYNFFYPNMRCVDKKQAGQKTRRIYEKETKTPYRRVMESADVGGELKELLRKRKVSLNILSLQRKLDAALENLDRFVQHTPGSPTGCHGASLPQAHG
jgi:hypothetical protein